MQRAKKMCKSCPFRGIDEAEKRRLAIVPDDHWPCHTEDGYGVGSGIQCRGHWEARRKYPPSPEATAKWLADPAPDLSNYPR